MLLRLIAKNWMEPCVCVLKCKRKRERGRERECCHTFSQKRDNFLYPHPTADLH